MSIDSGKRKKFQGKWQKRSLVGNRNVDSLSCREFYPLANPVVKRIYVAKSEALFAPEIFADQNGFAAVDIEHLDSGPSLRRNRFVTSLLEE